MSRGLGRMQRQVLLALLDCERCPPYLWGRQPAPDLFPVFRVFDRVCAAFLHPRRAERARESREKRDARKAELTEAIARGSNSAAQELADIQGFEGWLAAGKALASVMNNTRSEEQRLRAQTDDEGNISRAIASLARRGLVGRFRRCRTGLGSWICLTDEGRRVAASLSACQAETADHHAVNLGHEALDAGCPK